MKKIQKLTSIVLALLMLISVFAAVPTTAGAAESKKNSTGYTLLNESQFATKLSELKSMYPEKSSPDYTYYENGTALAWTCKGFANKLAYYCFGSSQYTSNGGWEMSHDKSSFNAGDIVSVNNDGHTIFITYVNGSTIRYAEGNHTWGDTGYYSAVRWDVQISLSELQGKFYFKYHLNGNNLTGGGSPIITPTGTQTISDGEYLIASALDRTSCISIASNSKDAGANVNLWQNVSDDNTTAIVNVKHEGNGYYSLTFKHSGMSMDVNDYGTTNGTNVLQYYPTTNDNQRWVIKETGDGYYFNIISKCNGLYLDLVAGSSSNGTNIQMYEGNNSDAQKWCFIASGLFSGQTVDEGEYYITSGISSSLSLDVNGTTGENLANVQVWNERLSNMDKFRVKYLGNGYYKIFLSNVNRCIDLKDNNPYSGTNIQLANTNNSAAQQWIIKFAGGGCYNIVSKSSGLVLDSKGGKSTNGNNVQAWLSNDSEAQKWRFIPVNATKSSEYNGHTYEYFKCRSNFAQAYEHCERLGGHLVTINSKEENDFLTALTNGYSGRAWIGGSAYGGTNWHWIKREPFNRTNWAPNEPSNNGENCVDMYVSGDNAGQWNDENLLNGNVEGFICEYGTSVDSDSYSPVTSAVYGNHSYEFYELTIDWQSAKSICEAKGGHLVIINNSSENNFITTNIGALDNNEYWIGCTDIAFEGNWEDVNNNSLSYTNWDDSDPDNHLGFEDYAAITTSGKWIDLKSLNFINRSIGFICEYDEIKPEPVTQPTEPSSSETQPTQTTEATQATEPTQSTQTTEPTAATQPTQPTQATEPTQTTEATQLTQATEPTEVTQTTEATQSTEATQATQQTTPAPNLRTVYFLNTPEWSTVNCYAYNKNGGEMSAFPGTSMIKTGYTVNGHYVYCFTFDFSLYDTVVFTNGSLQTAPLTPQADKCYRIDTGEWFDLDGNTDTEPTTEAKTTITLKAVKTSIYVGDTTTVKAAVTNPNGATAFTSSNSKIATVSSKGVVKGLKAGSVTITAKNNGKSASVKITVKQKANTITAKASTKTVKYATVKKKAVTVSAITVKNAKGKVTYKKLSGNSKITVNTKTGKLTVKKGTKKSTYTIKVKVTAAGNTTYKAGSKTVTVKIKVK